MTTVDGIPAETFYQYPTLEVAQALLGCMLVVVDDDEEVGGVIVETEAYGPDDPASHAFRGRTLRNAAMFGPPGTAYVYRSYGVHWCANVVTGPVGTGEAVLIRSLEPCLGIPRMEERRRSTNVLSLCSGPGKLCQALAIGPDDNGSSLRSGRLLVAGSGRPPQSYVSRPRIGITSATDRLWRFVVRGSSFASRPLPREERHA